jgi:phosphate transport system protein
VQPTQRRHTDREYEAQLESVRRNLITMAGRVEEMIASSVRALVERDVTLAQETIGQDAKVNQTEVETDGLCLQILARRQPLASDLRFVTLALKMVTDLERIGDLAVNIAERAIDMAGQPPLKPWRDIPQMADAVQAMVREAIDAFVQGDARMAQAVIDRDPEVDETYTRVVHELLGIMTHDVSTVERGIHVLSVAKFLERMADHATNLAEQVVFLVHGTDIRHQSSVEEPE